MIGGYEPSLALVLNLWWCIVKNNQRVLGKSTEERLFLSLQKPRKVSSPLADSCVQSKMVPHRRSFRVTMGGISPRGPGHRLNLIYPHSTSTSSTPLENAKMLRDLATGKDP